MGFFVLLILIIGIVAIVSASNSGKGSYGGYNHGYVRDYDEDEYEDYETRAAIGERDYFTDDLARNYDSYYAQVADDAMMGDESAMEEMRGEFGDGSELRLKADKMLRWSILNESPNSCAAKAGEVI